MSKLTYLVPLLLLPSLLRCADDGEGTSTPTGGAQNTGGSATTGGSSTGGASGMDTGGSGGTAGDGGSTATGGSAGAGGAGGSGGSGGSDTGGTGDGGEGASGGAPSCMPSADDTACENCMRENCCAEWQACEADAECNACGECLSQENADLAMCIGSMDCGDVLTQPVSSAMVLCACGGGGVLDCTGPCAADCGLAP